MRKQIMFVTIVSLLAACSIDGQDALLKNENERNMTKELGQEEAQEELLAASATAEGDSVEEINEAFMLDAEFFNEIETVDGQAVIQNPENIMVFVNPDFSLPSDFHPEDLVIPDVAFPFEEDVEKKYLRAEAAEALENLFAHATEEGIELFAISGYRSYNRQEVLYANAVANYGEDQAVSAVPGQSEHQTGLAMDVSSRSNQLRLTGEFGETAEGKWLAENAHKHGYIIRYKQGKEDITGFIYEPWHIRYVGKEIAEIIYENDLTLEEYMEVVKKA